MRCVALRVSSVAVVLSTLLACGSFGANDAKTPDDGGSATDTGSDALAPDASTLPSEGGLEASPDSPTLTPSLVPCVVSTLSFQDQFSRTSPVKDEWTEINDNGGIVNLVLANNRLIARGQDVLGGPPAHSTLARDLGAGTNKTISRACARMKIRVESPKNGSSYSGNGRTEIVTLAADIPNTSNTAFYGISLNQNGFAASWEVDTLSAQETKPLTDNELSVKIEVDYVKRTTSIAIGATTMSFTNTYPSSAMSPGDTRLIIGTVQYPPAPAVELTFDDVEFAVYP